MKSSLFASQLGAIVIALGALLVLCGNFLPSNGDYQFRFLHDSPSDPVSLVFLILPALIVFAMSAYCWFWNAGRVFLTLSLTIIVLALLWHFFLQGIGGMGGMMRCFDICSPETFSIGAGFWLPIVGNLLSSIGIIVAFASSSRNLASVNLRPIRKNRTHNVFP
jgi:hypothetical protein